MSEDFDALGPIEQRTLADVVAARLRDAITRGELAPGRRLTEPELAESLNVSRSPIREALVRLKGEGLVVGTTASYVWRPNEDEVDEVFSIQTVLMTLAAEWLITENRLTEEDFIKAESMIDRLRRQLDDGAPLSPLSVLASEEALQEYLLRKSGHSLLTRLWRQTVSQWWLLMNNYLRYEDPAEIARRLVADHQSVIEALRNENRDGVKACIEAANKRCCARVKEVLRWARERNH